MGILQEALKYREKGISVIPMTTYLDERGDVKKRPLIAWTEFQNRLPSTDEIKKWFNKNPKALIGGVCGKISNLSAVDCDNPRAVDLYANLIVEEPTRKTPTSKTPRGGNHFLYNAPENCPGPISTADGLDFRGEGSLIILPPSQNCKGGRYEFLPGLSLDEVERPPLPQSIIDFVRSNSFSKKPGEGFNGQMFKEGNRDNSLFHTSLYLLKGGMRREEVYQVLAMTVRGWGEEPDPKWLWAKIESAEKRLQLRDRNLTQEVRDIISMTSGQFKIGQIYRDLPNIGTKDRAYIRVVLRRLIDEKVIERIGKEDGVFRRIENVEEVLDLRQKAGGEFSLKMPFALEEKVKTFPKSIIVVGAGPDGGKTGFLLNVAVMNRNAHKVTYFTCEMGLEEFQDRADKLGLSREEWFKKIKVIVKGSDFSDSIRPDGLNILDYLDLGADDFPRVGEIIRRIWEKLTTGICFIGIQKKYGTDLPQGGIGSIQLARLAVSLDHGVIKIIKAKNWRNPKANPNGLEMRFKLADGWKFTEEGTWTRGSETVKTPGLYNRTEKQYKQSGKKMGKYGLTKEFEGIVS